MIEENQLEKNKQVTSERIINDFCLTVCTVNGSGSATANSTLVRSFFRMGIPVSGKISFLRISKACRPGFRYGSQGWLPGSGCMTISSSK